ncbi:3'(2'),5'-bisphosphate nucleotidase CysQ family protein [Microvirga terricola]|uniref:3'(2'),5'-bisphosphate nucleotidase CysQ n=1 Tax=Microvirga terricola TaxID=2719797 RepID=A0ABX0VE50_9HYPH|nr:3'(2'),5'-bisphosphate nucleotidase CysQ [Microvirga terricola]NIX76152.1 3'(2'),5'-bisphosphate nucleotidase CysQ [Microvirga terricola]
MMRLEDQNADDVALKLAQIAVEAGRVLRRMECEALEKHIKDDGTPTTAADLAAELLIIRRLNEDWPGVPIVAEETASTAAPNSEFFLVDPLDGTGDYINGTGEYSVNIALVRNHRPVAAVVSAPALGSIWIAGNGALVGAIPEDADGDITWRKVGARVAPEQGLIALVSRRHGDDATEACLSTLSIGTRRMTSSALKFCLIASGEADVYVRCGPTMEWDTAAGDHILSRAGGCVIGPGGSSLTYGHEDRGYLNGPFAALGDIALAPRLALPVACDTAKHVAFGR